jgi:hypothetical protein
LYASFNTRTPPGVAKVSIRQAETRAPFSAAAHSAAESPSSRPQAVAASAFGTMCSPGTASSTRSRSPAASKVNEARPSSASPTSEAWTSASASTPKVTTRAEVAAA